MPSNGDLASKLGISSKKATTNGRICIKQKNVKKIKWPPWRS